MHQKYSSLQTAISSNQNIILNCYIIRNINCMIHIIIITILTISTLIFLILRLILWNNTHQRHLHFLILLLLRRYLLHCLKHHLTSIQSKSIDYIYHRSNILQPNINKNSIYRILQHHCFIHARHNSYCMLQLCMTLCMLKLDIIP